MSTLYRLLLSAAALYVAACAIDGCVAPRRGTCECVCAWPAPSEESGRFFFLIDAGNLQPLGAR